MTTGRITSKQGSIVMSLVLVVGATMSLSCEGGSSLDLVRPAVTRELSSLCTPIRLLVEPDKTLSTDSNETPIPVIDEIRQPVERLLLRCGGEILIGVVREHSNRRLKRLQVTAPPAAPPVPLQNQNPLILKTQVMPKYEAGLRTYQTTHAAWERDTRAQFQTYFEEAKQLLEQKPFATRSDVFGAVARGDAALAEPDAAFGGTTNEYFILVSDGIDNVHKERPVMRSGAKVLLVNGTGSSGSLEGLVNAHFESVASAIQYVLASEGVR